MKAIIPVAGFGTRMRPHTLTHPKVLLPVADKPMIGHIVGKLLEDGIDEFIFVVGYLGDKIEDYIRSTFDVSAHFLEQTEFLGLGHAIYTARPFLDNDPVIIVLGDTIYDVHLREVLKEKHSALGVKEVEDPRRFGVAVLDEQGNIARLVEKPQEYVSNLALVGLYYFRNGKVLEEALEEMIEKGIKTRDEFQLTDAIQLMMNNGEKIKTFQVEGWYDCGKPNTLLSTNRIILERDFSDQTYDFPNSIIIPPVYIHPDATVSNSLIGPNVTVGRNCTIEEAIIRDSIIGGGAEIKRINMRESMIGDYASLQGRAQILNMGDYSEFNFDKQ
ncbi:MAG: sugar phosphate nucleotidyltransferase [Calditrichia bacterium]